MNDILEFSNPGDNDLSDIELKNNLKSCLFLKYYNSLKNHKDIIDNYIKEWDNFKKYMNPYELIYSPYQKNMNTSQYKPISRSFFKMWEMLHKFNLLEIDDNIVIGNIAEGPGGFIEAILRYRQFNNKDVYISNTLYPSDKSIPSWNKLNRYKDERKIDNINILYCDLYNYKNLIKYISYFKDKKAYLVTADGGFDYSSDFNNQEYSSSRIIYSEIVCAFSIQELGGNFVIKIFDTFNIFTLKCIYLLYKFYKTISLYKPLTSRVANSEKYIICKGFKGINYQLLIKFLDSINNFPTGNPDISTIKLPNEFIYQFDNYNKLFVDNQISFIDKTLEMIKNKDPIDFEKIVEEQVVKAKEWCEEYNFK